MNFLNRGFLKLALLPQGFYQRMGINTAQLKAILTTKLLMDDRKPTPMAQARRRKNAKPVNRATLGTVLVSVLFGLFYLLLFSVGKNVVTQLTFYFSVFFVMLSLTLISDFTSVLIDVRDNFIILPKPVNDRTFVVARLLHIFIHICKIVLPMSLPGLVYVGMEYGAGGALLFAVIVFLLTAFSIFFINALYLLILKLTTPQRFQAIIGTVQIVFAIVMYGGYQLFPRLLSWIDLAGFDITQKSGIVAYPVYWLAQSWNVAYNLGGTTVEILLGLLGLFFPVFCVFAVVRYLAPSFNRKLALLSATAESAPTTTKQVKEKQNFYVGFWRRLVTGSRAEQAGFDLAWKMTARSRDFKLKVYPSMGYLVVYVFIVLLNNRRIQFDELGKNDLQTKVLIVSALYFTSFLLMMAISQIAYSDKFKASWRYFVSPLTAPGEVIAGATKAVLLKFYIPIVLVITVAGVSIGGPLALPNVVFGLFNQVLIAGLRVYIGHKYFPFALQQSNQVKAGSFLRGLAVLLLSGLIAAGHFLLYSFTPVIVLCAVLSVVASWLVFDALKKTSWERMMSRYAED